MAWIEFHDTVAEHYKTKDLARFMGWELNAAVGTLARFWLWCTKFADDGDLRKHNDDRIGDSVGLNGNDAKRFVDAMVQSGWIDRKPYFRVHDWWDYSKSFMKSRYKDIPEKWQSIKSLYDLKTPTLHRSNTRATPATDRPEQTGTDRQVQTSVAAKKNAAPTPQADFISRFQATYEAKAGEPFKAERKDFVIAAELIRTYGIDACVRKAMTFSEMCESRSAWFTKEGWGAFTIGKLSSQWNSIIPGATSPTKEDEFRVELKKQEAIRAGNGSHT